MNYGKFFRLNQRTSKIEDGVSIYDYIDIPAYFESSESNEMSPKYPISMTITESSVRFRVHYCAYRIERTEQNDTDGSNIDNDYLYGLEEAYNTDSKASIRHMEEVILELPFANNSTDDLYNVIKDIYVTRYPILDRDNDGNKISNYIYNLLLKRYDDTYSFKSKVEEDLYKSLRRNCDSDSSYSTLWLMGLAKNNKYNLFKTDNSTKPTKEVVGFLRKLLLDFMFDLKHSDVFQTSKYYQNMYSGLMSNFFFSGLIHKCEYYFYRGLITDLIKKNLSNEKVIKDHIQGFYVKALIDAETLWIHDIMSPAAERYFEHYYSTDIIETTSIDVSPNDYGLKIFFQKINSQWEKFAFRKWNSWFASPEEEMRRVHFSMKESAEKSHKNVFHSLLSYLQGLISKTKRIERIKEIENTNTDTYHICNAETVIAYLNSTKEQQDKKLNLRKNSNKTEVSQWFLRRYAISDAMHMHFIKYATIPLYLTIVILFSCLFIFPEFITQDFWKKYYYLPILYIIGWGLLGIFFYLFSRKWIYHKTKKENILFNIRRKVLKRRAIGIFSTLFLSLLILALINRTANELFPIMSEVSSWGTSLKIVVIMIQVLLVIIIGSIIYKWIYPVHWLSNMHVFFPRLVASIAAAWLTLAAGDDLFIAFFDSIVSWSTSIWLSVIVFIFVMYEINKMLPLETTYVKVNRSLSIMAISYLVSLIVGFCIVNFMGERMLESSGILRNFYVNNVDQVRIKQVENKRYALIRESRKGTSAINDSTPDSVLLSELQYIHIIDEDKTNDVKTDEKGLSHPIATTWKLSGKEDNKRAKFFILREFLIQFAFVAMFIGIFIQMIFEEKSITEV